VLGFPNILKKGTDILSTPITIIYCLIVIVNIRVLGLTNILQKGTDVLSSPTYYIYSSTIVLSYIVIRHNVVPYIVLLSIVLRYNA
jgi:hypothetical protein